MMAVRRRAPFVVACVTRAVSTAVAIAVATAAVGATFTATFTATATAAAPAQAPPQPGQPFESRAEIVLVDVTVIDGDGRQVADLQAEDFALDVAGRPRPVRSAQYVAVAAPPAPGTAAAAAAARQASSTSNVGTPSGRLLLLIVDESYLGFGANRAILRAAEALLERLGPGDLVGLARFPDMTGGVEFTADIASVRAALRNVTGRSPLRSARPVLSLADAQSFEEPGSGSQIVIARECPDPSDQRYLACVATVQGAARDIVVDHESRTAATVGALDGLFTRLRPLNRPVNAVVISEGLFVGRNGTAQIDRVAARAAASRISLHVVRPARDLYDMQTNQNAGELAEGERLLREGLEQLASGARGAMFTAAGTGDGVFDRIGRELAGYYLLGFEPTNEDRTSGDRRIAVTVRRRGVTVRARRSFDVPASNAITFRLTPPERLQQALRAALPSAGVPIRVATYSLTSGDGTQARVLVSAEIGEPISAEASVPVGLIVIDGTGKVVATHAAEVALRPAQSSKPSPGLFLTSVLIPPGEYTLRLAAVGSGGVGTVHHPFSARLHPAPGGFAFTDVIVAALSGAGGEPRPSPSATVDGDRLVVMLEGQHADATALAAVRVTFEVADAAKPEAVTSVVALSEVRSNGTQRAFGSTLVLDRLPAGEYLVRARIELPGRPPMVIERPFRFEASPVLSTAAPPAATRGTAAVAAATAAGTAAVVRRPLPPLTKVTVSVPTFTVRDVLQPNVVNRFLDVLVETYPPSGAALPVVERARAGTFTPAATALAGGSDDVVLLFIGGLAALEQGQVPQATTLFQRTLRAAPDFIGVAFFMGATHAAGGRDREAAGAWQMSLLSPEAEPAFPLLVDALLRIGEAQRALDTIEGAPDAWKTSREKFEREALAEAAAGRHAEALPKIQQLIAERSGDLGLLFVGIQLLYASHLAMPLTGADLARFDEWTGRYGQAAGPERAQVTAWRAAVMNR
jgi:VWFA-related protein